MGSAVTNPAKVMLIGIGALLAVGVLAILSPVVKLVIVAALLAYVLAPAARFLESRGMSRPAATTTIFVAIFLLIGLLTAILLPVLTNEIATLSSGISSEKTAQLLTRFEEAITVELSFLGVRELALSERLQHALADVGSWLFGHLSDAAAMATSMILVPFIVFFLMKDGRAFKGALLSLVPNRYFELTLSLLYKLNVQFGNYLRGQLLDSLLVGVLTTAALWALGVRYFLMIGIFTGLANIVPYFGPITGAALAVVFSILQTGGPGMVLSIVAAFAVIKLIDDVLLQPLIVARTVQMHPLVVLLTVLAGGQLFGILGMLLSVPVAGFIKVVMKESIPNYQNYGQKHGEV